MDDVLALECTRCGRRFDPDAGRLGCPDHEDGTGSLDVVLDESAPVSRDAATPIERMWDFASLLPVATEDGPVTLGEGGTPLVDAPTLSARYDVDCSLKLEGGNPTGSVKDRGTAAVATAARNVDATGLACASTGNAAASLAAYATRAGLDCLVFVPGDVPAGKAVQPLVTGAEVVAVDGDYGDASALCRQVTARPNWVSRRAGANPAVRAGMGTLGYELLVQHEAPPDWVVVPMGNGGAIAGLWSGLAALADARDVDAVPKLLGVQTDGITPIFDAFEGTPSEDSSETIADSIAVRDPDATGDAVRALEESDGAAVVVSDADIRAAQRELGEAEGVFAEPASAATLAALDRARESGIVPAGAAVSLLVTGTGLKDVATASAATPERTHVAADVSVTELAADVDVFE